MQHDKIRGYEQRLPSFIKRCNQTFGTSALMLLESVIDEIIRDIKTLDHTDMLLSQYNSLKDLIHNKVIGELRPPSTPAITSGELRPPSTPAITSGELRPPSTPAITSGELRPPANANTNTNTKNNVRIESVPKKRKKIKTVQAKKDEANRKKRSRNSGRNITANEQEYLRLKRLKQFTSDDIEIDESKIPKKFKPMTEEEVEQRTSNLLDAVSPSNMENIDIDVYNAAIPDPSVVRLREHQEKVAKHLLTHRGVIAIHSVGSGKTLLAAVCARYMQIVDPEIKIIFIAPKSLLTNFENEVKRAYGQDLDMSNYLFYTYEKFMIDYHEGLIDCYNSFLIIDEAHKLRTHFKMVNHVLAVPHTVDAVMKCARKAKKVLLLTATPVVNDPYDIINLITIIDGDLRPILKKDFGKIYKNGMVNDRQRFYDFFHDKISIYVRPYDENYPTSKIHTVNINMDNKYYEEYKRVEDILLTDNQLEVYGPNDLEPFYNGIRRAVGADVEEYNPKLDWIKIFLECQRHKIDSTGKYRKTVIFAPFISLGIKQLEELVKDFEESERPKFGEITGKHTKKERQLVIDKYNRGDIHVLLLSVGAGGLGINLFGTRDAIITTPGWNDVEFEQSIGRVIRYKGHEHLPVEERHVDIWKLMMVKPYHIHDPQIQDDRGKPSADYIVEAIAQRKTDEILKFMNELHQVAI
jgi:superfamily II DNA or RNA helicase